MDIKHRVFCFMGIGQICFSVWASVEEKFHEIHKFDTFNFAEIQDSESGKEAQKEEYDALWKYNLFQKIKKIAAVGGPVIVNSVVALFLSWISKSRKAFPLYFAGLEVPSFFAVSRPLLKKVDGEKGIQSLYPMMINQVMNSVKSDGDLQSKLLSKKVKFSNGLSVGKEEVIQNIDLAAFVGYPKLFERELKKIFSTLSFENEEDLSNFQSSFLRRTIGLLMEGEFYQLWKILLRFVNGSQFFVPVVLESLYQAILLGRQKVIDALWQDLNAFSQPNRDLLIRRLMSIFIEAPEISDKETLSIWNVPQDESWKFLYSFVQKCVESQIKLPNEIYDYLLMAMSMGTGSDDQSKFAEILEKSSLNLQSSKFYLCLVHFFWHKKEWCIAQIFKKLSQQNVDLNQHIPEKFCRFMANSTKEKKNFKEFDQSCLEFILQRIDQLLEETVQSVGKNFPWHDIGESLFNLVKNVNPGQNTEIRERLNVAYQLVFACLTKDPQCFSFDQLCKDVISLLKESDRINAIFGIITNKNTSNQDVIYLVNNFPQDYFMQYPSCCSLKISYIETLVGAVLSRKSVDTDLIKCLIKLIRTKKNFPESVYGMLGAYMGKNEKVRWEACEAVFGQLFAQNHDQDVFEKMKCFLCYVFNNRQKDQQQFLMSALQSKNSQIQQLTEILMWQSRS